MLKLFCCIPTLYINYDSYVNVVFYLLISEFIAFCIKHCMLRKVPKIKDFYVFCLCSKTTVSTCCNVDKGIYYYTTYDNSSINAVDMYRENLDGTDIITYDLITSQKIEIQN